MSDASASRMGEGPCTTAALEQTLLDIWRRVLRVAEIGRDDNFFDLGGDSLLAVHLFLEIERATGVDLPITAIYDAPTVEEMARLLREEAAPQSSLLVLLKPGTGDPLYIVHGIGGTVMEFEKLGRHIRVPEPVYAIQAQGLDGKAAPLATIGEIADLYVTAIRSVQPSGPYRLCGYSFGGLVAMEMATRLKAAGHGIAALILIDAYAHPATWPILSRRKMRVRRALHLLWRARGRSPVETFAQALRYLKTRGYSRRLYEWLLDENPSLPLPLLRVREAGGAALRAYRPAPYAGPVTFLKARERDSEFPDDAERIWRRLAPRAVFRTIAGGHRTIVTDHADTAAAALTACLHSLRAGAAPQQRHDDALAQSFDVTPSPLLREAV
ncbi:MAG TPA: alpha/beta fold hydrolase [Rhizomicrobium sp.]|nr:alpha/beta fold hydrolase [Rhizomicrobium sp.]